MKESASIKKKHPVSTIIILLIIVLALSVMSLGVGSIYISPWSVLQTFFFGVQDNFFILYNYRLPRVLIALIVGACLGISGAILQGILRNPLASPDVIGVTKGAGLAAAIVIILLPSSPLIALPISAFIGASIIAILLMIFSHRTNMRPSTLALVGVALGAICQAGIQYTMIKFPDDVNTTLVWLTGSLWSRGWNELVLLIPCLMIIPFCFLLSSKLNILALGDDVAVGLGEKAKKTRYILLAVAVVLTGLSVAVVGSIGFIGLIAPHISRRLVGNRAGVLLPASALCGAVILLVSDSLGRGLVPPTEIPAGIITAVIGAPYFLYLLKSERKSS